MADYHGTHGTCRSNAKNIMQVGFRKGEGRLGSGVYFWAEGAYAEELAIGWYKQALKEGRYWNESDKNGVIIFATMSSDDKFVLDLESRHMNYQLASLAFKQKIDPNDSIMRKFLFGVFIDGLERKLGIQFRIILMKVAPPDRTCCKYPIGLLGAPLCIVARVTNCITINDIKPMEEIGNE